MAKKIDLSTILIENVIVHNIPKHRKGETSVEPKYSEKESKLTDGLRLFFKDKVVQALKSDKAFKICFDSNNTSPVSWQVTNALTLSNDDLVTYSTIVAKYLFDIQVGSNAAGILVVMNAQANDHRCCIILKLEMDKGAQLTLDPDTQSYDIKEVEDLMLTQKTRIFKVAMFILRKDFNAKYDGVIMDYQIDIKAKKDVTTWFMERFLGCIAFADPKITTQKFYNLTRAFIDTVEDPITKTKYIEDLNSYVQKNSTTLSPKEFAVDYLKTTADQNEYKKYLESKKFKFSAFQKDLTQINRQVQKIAIEFENGVSILGKGSFKNKVKLTTMGNGQTKAEVVSKIKKIN